MSLTCPFVNKDRIEKCDDDCELFIQNIGCSFKNIYLTLDNIGGMLAAIDTEPIPYEPGQPVQVIATKSKGYTMWYGKYKAGNGIDSITLNGAFIFYSTMCETETAMNILLHQYNIRKGYSSGDLIDELTLTSIFAHGPAQGALKAR